VAWLMHASLMATQLTALPAFTGAATEVLAIVAYKQPITRAGIDRIRGTNGDSALDTLLVRGLVEFDQHHLVVTTRAFRDLAGLRDVGDLPPLPDADAEATSRELLEVS
jgi:segregation and condensation protein B